MSTVTVNISFQDRLLAEIDREAERESRSRSELLREAARIYVARQRKWEDVFRIGDSTARDRGVTPEMLEEEIAAVRAAPRRE